MVVGGLVPVREVDDAGVQFESKVCRGEVYSTFHRLSITDSSGSFANDLSSFSVSSSLSFTGFRNVVVLLDLVFDFDGALGGLLHAGFLGGRLGGLGCVFIVVIVGLALALRLGGFFLSSSAFLGGRGSGRACVVVALSSSVAARKSFGFFLQLVESLTVEKETLAYYLVKARRINQNRRCNERHKAVDTVTVENIA